MSGFRQVGTEPVFSGHIIDVEVGTFLGPDGSEFTRDIVRHPGAVSAVPLHGDGTVTLVRQYRAVIDAEILEIPAGLRDVADEEPSETARRELVEEVGLSAGSLELLAEFHNSAGFCDEHSWVFLATDLVDVETDLQGPEEQEMEIVRVSLDAVPAMIASGELIDAKTIIGLSLALLKR